MSNIELLETERTLFELGFRACVRFLHEWIQKKDKPECQADLLIAARKILFGATMTDLYLTSKATTDCDDSESSEEEPPAAQEDAEDKTLDAVIEQLKLQFPGCKIMSMPIQIQKK